MCRLLCVRSETEFDIQSFLKKFSVICKKSQEYQGHGWGLAFLKEGEWQHYKNIKPIWEDDLAHFGRTKYLIAHARSAFEDRDIVIEYNMPFYDDRYVFIFNGELRGVTIKEEGRIGAEKIFNFIKRFDKGDMKSAMEKAVPLIKKRAREIKALNIIIATKENVFLNTYYSMDPDYFTMHFSEKDDMLRICSMPFPGEEWTAIPNDTIKVW
ncbi:class II glutamine amidotransferase [Candidatus Woesearchaeota archaeon]|nr:class II glutamine amidotransferase [Candidatus Woesearchaeota archaeon]